MNQYYTPAQVQLQDYYVGRPIGMIAELAGQQQKAYDTGLANIDAVDETFKVDAHASESHLAKQLVDQYRTKLSDIQDQFIKTGDPRIASKAKKLAQQFANDPYKITIEQNKKGYLEEEKRQSELTAKDKGWEGYNFLKSVYDKNQKNTSLDQLSPFNPTGDFRYYRTKQDVFKTADEMTKNIARDSYDARDLVSEVNGELTWKKHGYKDRVNMDKVIRVAEATTSNFLESDAGKFFIDEYFNTPIQDFNKLPTEYKERVTKAATGMLARTAYKQIGGGVTDEDSKQFDQVLRKRGFAKQDIEKATGTADLLSAETSENAAMAGEFKTVDNILTEFDRIEKRVGNKITLNLLDDPRNVFGSLNLDQGTKNYLNTLSKQYLVDQIGSLRKGSAEDNKKADAIWKDISTNNKLDYKKLVTKHKQILEASNATYNKHVKFNEAQQDAFDFMLNDLPNRNIIDSNTGEPADINGLFNTDVDKKDFKITGLEGPSSAWPGYLQLIDTKSNKKYLLQPNDEVSKKATRAMTSLGKAISNTKVYGALGDDAIVNGTDLLPRTINIAGKTVDTGGLRFRPVKYTDGKEIKIKYVPEVIKRDGTWKPMDADMIKAFRKETNDDFSNINNMLTYLKNKISKEGVIGNYNNTQLIKLSKESEIEESDEDSDYNNLIDNY